MPAHARLLVLALDAASPALLRRWAEDGTLPNVAGLLCRGMSADLRSVDGLYVGATWPSFYTARDPSEHGIYWLDRLRLGSYWTYRCGARELGAYPSLWDVLSGAGRRAMVLDVPMTRPTPHLNGLQVNEWGVHDAVFGFRTTPNSLRRKILRDIGPHPVPRNCDARRNCAAYRRFAAQLVEGARLRARLTRDLLRSHEWDFAIQVFSETHCAGHQLWHFHDPQHPCYDADVTSASGDLLRDVYIAVDKAVGEILATVDRDTTVVLMALHGMSHVCGGSLLLPEILQQLGVFTGPTARSTIIGSQTREGNNSRVAVEPSRVLRRTYNLLPQSLRDRSYRLRSRAHHWLTGRTDLLCPHPAASSAFPVGLGTGSNWSGIRLNLRGREPQGILTPGREAERFCKELSNALLAFTRLEPSLPLVRRVIRIRDLYDGPHLDELPDLLVEWNAEPPMGTDAAGNGIGSTWQARSDQAGLIQARNRYCRTGEHRIEGIMVAQGVGIARGKLERQLSILDLAPTFALMQGCEMPTRHGRLIPELVGAPV